MIKTFKEYSSAMDFPSDELIKKYKEETPGQTDEKLDPRKHNVADYIKDFKKSDAPQFKGKTDKEIEKMAIAAYLQARDDAGIKET